jgi:hypothetical protein
MKAEDFRINNLVHYTDGSSVMICKLDAQDLLQMSVDEDYMNLHVPIPLTEEILLKCGFEKPKFSYDFGKLSIVLRGVHGYKNGRTYFNSWCIIEKQIEYIHQLQNLYFALTGEELKIEL